MHASIDAQIAVWTALTTAMPAGFGTHAVVDATRASCPEFRDACERFP